MSGIYIHIPFCKQACHYCDFHFSTSIKNKNDFLDALKKEIGLRKNYLSENKISTIYFGGGTPSLLSKEEIMRICDELNNFFVVDKSAEITLEANPDDLTKEKLLELKKTPVNRLSIGIQSFRNEDLKWMNRSHTSENAIASVKFSQDAGFENITIDLIYGIPDLSNDAWRKNLSLAFSLGVPHISAYCLTVEPRTVLASFIKKRKTENVNDQKSVEHFEILIEEMRAANFIQYEISNFCKENFYSKHNSNYWKNEHYLGLGPSSHSFDGASRQWNIANNNLYIDSLNTGNLNFEKEILTQEQKCNEYILTSLRTVWGTDLDFVKKTFGEKIQHQLFDAARKYVVEKKIIYEQNKFFLTDKGKLIADKIASDLFIVE